VTGEQRASFRGAQLQCFWPGAAGVFAEIDSPIALAFLKRYPTPAAARGLGEQRMAQFLARRSYSGRKSPRELLGRLHSAAQGRAEALETEARRQIVLALIAALEPIVAKIAQLTSEIRGVLAEHDDGATFRSLFKDPTSAITAATMLAEIGDCRERYPTKQALSADGGQSPVAVESGKSKRARFRWACDHRLRNAIGTLADTSRHHNPWAADIYQRAIARGATHPHAIRILGRVGIPANAFVAKGKRGGIAAEHAKQNPDAQSGRATAVRPRTAGGCPRRGVGRAIRAFGGLPSDDRRGSPQVESRASARGSGCPARNASTSGSGLSCLPGRSHRVGVSEGPFVLLVARDLGGLRRAAVAAISPFRGRG
jgi:hypothetical protein